MLLACRGNLLPQVSAHTGRVHLHLAPDGSRPAGLSLPLELLLVGTQRSGLLKGLLQQHADRCGCVPELTRKYCANAGGAARIKATSQ